MMICLFGAHAGASRRSWATGTLVPIRHAGGIPQVRILLKLDSPKTCAPLLQETITGENYTPLIPVV